jgi:hypothetical protein
MLKSAGKDGMVWSSVQGRRSRESDERPLAKSAGQSGSDIRVDSEIQQSWKDAGSGR